MKDIIDKRAKINILELKRTDISVHLKDMFAIISKNMNEIAPTGNSLDEDYKIWKKCMEQEAQDNSKKWIIALYNHELIGYFLYRKFDNIVYLDEIQIKKEHQNDKSTFIKLFSYILEENFSEDIDVFTYVNKNNIESQGIVTKFGFIKYDETDRGFKYKINWLKLKETLEKYPL